MEFKKNVKTKKYLFHIKHKKTGKCECVTKFAESVQCAILQLPEDIDIMKMEVVRNGK